MTFKQFFAKLKDILFPNGYKCLFCNEEINNDIGVCDRCLQTLPFVDGDICEICGRRVNADTKVCDSCKNILPVYQKAFSVFWYKDQIAAKVKGLKFGGHKYYGYTLSKFMLHKFEELDINIDVIIPIPLHPKRLKKRGYNQTEILLTSFVDAGYNVVTNAVVRVKDTKMQARLDRESRQQNIIDAFQVIDPKAVKGKTVLVVDDVMTSGFTANECSRVLIAAGAKDVYVMTLARADY